MFRRKIETTLEEFFSNASEEKALIVYGARQIGKTFIIREKAKQAYEHYAEVDLKDDFESGQQLFAKVKTTKDFYLLISSMFSDLDNKDNTIVFLDEIQFYPHLRTLLKPLVKEGRYRYIASASLLGITLRHSFIPMGAVSEVQMYPMDFEEFLWANNYSEETIDYLKHCFNTLESINQAVHDYTLSLFKDYLISGGLPDAVKNYVLNRNVIKTREEQKLIFDYYKDDCSKYDKDHNLKIRRLYDMLSSNMANTVKRIKFNSIEKKTNASLKNYIDEFDYLIDSGIALCSRAVSNPNYPLTISKSKDLVKLFYNDVGILSNILYKNNIDAILYADKNINLGSVYETVVAMELAAHGHELYYFDSKKVGEVDFLINDYDNLSIVPVEIKSGKDQANYRAIPKLIDPNGNYKLKKGYVFGNKNILKKEGNLITAPIYLVMFL